MKEKSKEYKFIRGFKKIGISRILEENRCQTVKFLYR